MKRYKTISSQQNDRNTLLYLIMVLLIVFILIIIPFHHWKRPVASHSDNIPDPPVVLNNVNISSRNERLDDPYFPPTYSYPLQGPPVAAAVPINVKTQGRPAGYEQIGILTAASANLGVSSGADGTLILPLMGRLTMRNRQKWQYYTMANGVGSIHTKLPVYSGKRACMSENGCDEIMTGDTLFVQGYNQPFIATIYENQTLEYIPVVL